MRPILLSILCFGMVQGAAMPQDYLAPELRSTVEALKADVAREATTNETARGRARVMWQWANAFALSERFIPVNVTAITNAIMAILPEDPVPPRLMKGLDDFIREFRVRDEQPDAIGSVSLDAAGPFKAESWQSIALTYTVGSLAVEEGGRVVLARNFLSDSGMWQYNNPAGDNFVSIRSSNPKVKFARDEVQIQGMHGGFRRPAPQLAYRIGVGTLSEGDTFTITYGDKSGGGSGYQMQTSSSDAAPLPVYVDFSGDGTLFSLPIPSYEVVGKELNALHGFAPSVVATGEAFEVSVRAEDVFYNRATGAIPEISVLLNGEPYGRLPAGTEAIQMLQVASIDTPGVYRFSFRGSDGKLLGSSNPVWVQESPDWRVYWGETHGHCGFAEGQGTPDGYFSFGRDDAKLDFITLSEHDIWLDDYEWDVLNDAVARYSVDGEFIVFPGYEWTSRRDRGGHHNVFFRRAGFDRVPVQEAPRLTQLYLGLHEKHALEDVLVIPHAHQLADWRTSDVYLETLVEIMSMHGTFDWFGERYLEQGREVGFIAASDDHLSHPGYSGGSGISQRQRGGLAAVFGAKLTADSIFDALRNRETYATSGERMILDATLNGHKMGTRQAFAESRTLKGQVMGTAPIDTIEVIKNGDVIATMSGEFRQTNLEDHIFVQVNFASSSESTGRDNPRGYRPWVGSLEVSGARVKTVTTPGFQDGRFEWARQDWENENRVEFSTATRGRVNTMVLELEGASAETSIRVVLKKGRESGTAPIRIRSYAKIPAEDFSFGFDEFVGGRLSREFQVEHYTDEISMQLIDPNAELDKRFEFTDDLEPRHGDYYYLRVRQMDGALAWSSPFWVGGESPR